MCLAVNDAFVMDAWRIEEGAGRVTFFADGNGEFTAAMGMLVDRAPSRGWTRRRQTRR